MPLCTSCAYPAEHLYTTYSSKSNIRLGVCTRCGNFLDPLIEHPPLLLILDLILLKPRVYLHLLFNRGHPPKDGSRDAVPTPEPGASRDLWSDWALLSFATIASESATRLIAGRRTSHLTGSEVVRLVVLVIFELVAQHLATTAVALLALRLKGWHRRSAKAASSDGRQRHFEPIMISLTLLYTTLLPLVLQLVLGIWYTPDTHGRSDTGSESLAAAWLVDLLPYRSTQAAAVMICDLKELWSRTDRIWAGTKLLGGMSAGFGLRVILPTRPIETTVIVLLGWAATGIASRGVHFV